MTEYIFIVLIILLASTIRSAFGFGDALIAMPLLATFMSIKTATPFIALLGLTVSILILIQKWKTAYIKGLWILILFCLIGVPIGVLTLKYLNENVVKLILSVMIIVYGIYNLLHPKLITLKNEKLNWIFGFLSGFLGGAYNSNGPPIIIYGKLRNWGIDNFRAILQTVFLPTNIVIILSHGMSGFWTVNVFHYYLISLPAILIGTYLGGYSLKKIDKDRYSKIVDLLLISIGLVLFTNVIFILLK